MKHRVRHIVLLGALGALAALPATAGTVSGMVRNATTGKAAAGAEVVLMQLQGGMQPVADTKSDAQGRFRFDHPAIGQQPMLLRAIFRGVNYHQSLPPGRDTVDVEVFEPTKDPSAIEVTTHAIVVQPNGAVLLVGEEYTIENRTNPPKAFWNEQGSFEFELPAGAELGEVGASGPSGMPVVQGTIDKGPNHYAIAFPFRPGENSVRVSYHVPYASNQTTLRLASLYRCGRMLVVAPPTMQVAGEGFQAAGNEQGWNLYARNSVSPGASVAISISGTAPPPSDSEAQGSAEAQGNSRAGPQASSEASGVLPARLDSLKWILAAGFASLFALGAIFLWRKSRERAPVQAAAEVDRQVRGSIDEIKETLFRLELRRQAGTISDEEYSRQHAKAQKVLRELVRG
jgi:hypothetical protein